MAKSTPSGLGVENPTRSGRRRKAQRRLEASGQAIAYACALVELLDRGYTGQTLALMRAVHEVDRLLVAVNDENEERIGRRWLANQEVRQRDARDAVQRYVSRISEQMVAAGQEPPSQDVAELSRQLYGGMSAAAHHQRSIVDEAIDHESRTMIYGPDPRQSERLAYTEFAGALIQEVLITVGDALSFLWGPGFYQRDLAPMLRRFQEALDALDTYGLLRKLGFA